MNNVGDLKIKKKDYIAIENKFSVTEDKILGGRITILQPKKGYRVAIDPILMAASVPARKGDKILEIGAGSGAATFCLAIRVPDTELVGVELQSELFDLAKAAVAINRLDGRVKMVNTDLLDCPSDKVKDGEFDHVMANPPYLKKGTAIASPNPQIERAHIESKAILSDWISFAIRKLRKGGTITLIHRYDRKDEIVSELSKFTGDLTLFPLLPKKGASLKRIIIQAVKGTEGAIKISSGLILHEQSGKFTKEAISILKDGQELVI